jgi:hypothetical protein
VKGHPPHDLERLLRAARPTPAPGFVTELERSLRARSVKRERRRLRVAFAGAAFAVVLTSVVLAMSIGGLLPFTSGGSPANAGQHCHNVVTHPTERRPHFVWDRSGEPRIRYHSEVVRRVVKRCR